MTDIKKGRGRPPKIDRDVATERLLPPFQKKGFAGVGVAELCDTLDIVAPTFYGLYGSKLGAYDAVLDFYDARTAPLFAPALALADVSALIINLIETAAAAYSEGSNGCLVLEGARSSGDDSARNTALRRRTGMRNALADRFAEIGACSPDSFADDCIVIMSGLSSSARAGMDTTTLSTTARRLGMMLAARAQA